MNAIDTKIKAVIFDMDGLMLDTESQSLIAWQKITDINGYPFDRDFFISLIGIPWNESKAIIDRRLEIKGKAKIVKEQVQTERFRMIEKNGIPLKPGIINLLETLKSKNIPCSVATSTGREETLKHLKEAGLDIYFDSISCGDEVSKGKPDPEIFILSAKKTGFSPENCLVFEDSINGVLAASNAGIRTVMIPDIVQPDNELKNKAFRILSSLSEADQIIDELLE